MVRLRKSFLAFMVVSLIICESNTPGVQMAISEHRTKAANCLHCGRVLDACMSPQDGAPKVGDISICAYCRNVMVFAEDGSLRELKPEDVDGLAGNEWLLRCMEVLGRVKLGKKK